MWNNPVLWSWQEPATNSSISHLFLYCVYRHLPHGKWRLFVPLTLEQMETLQKLVAPPFLGTLNPPKVHDKSKKRKYLTYAPTP